MRFPLTYKFFNGIVLIVLDDELGLLVHDLWCEIGDLWKLITL
jgi:hypothetical protein